MKISSYSRRKLSWFPILTAILMLALFAGCDQGKVSMSADQPDPGVLAKLPNELKYLAEPALKYKLNGEFDIWPILDQMTPEQRVELETMGAKVLDNGHYDKVNEFLDQYPIDKYDEAAYLYFLFGLLDYADIEFA